MKNVILGYLVKSCFFTRYVSIRDD